MHSIFSSSRGDSAIHITSSNNSITPALAMRANTLTPHPHQSGMLIHTTGWDLAHTAAFTDLAHMILWDLAHTDPTRMTTQPLPQATTRLAHMVPTWDSAQTTWRMGQVCC